MSWIERSVEKRLADAAAAGELDTPHLSGKPLDLDSNRGDGWWAEQFVRRELSHDRRQEAVAARDAARASFWKAQSEAELRGLVEDANRAIVAVNINLVDADRLDTFDLSDVTERWRSVNRGSQ